MPAPFNYGIQTPDFQGQFLQGLQFLNAIEEQKKAKAQADNRQQVLTGFAQLQNPTADDYAKVVAQLPEDQELFKKIYDAKDEGTRNAIWNGGADAYSLADRGDAEAAAKRLEEYAAGFENKGDETHAQQFRDAATFARKDPAGAKRTIGLILQMADPEKFKNLGEQTAAIQNYEYFSKAVGKDVALEIAGATPKDGIQVLPNGMVIAGPDSPLAQSYKQPAAALPVVTTPAEYEALAPGSEYIADGVRRVKQGGTGGNASGGFRE